MNSRVLLTATWAVHTDFGERERISSEHYMPYLEATIILSLSENFQSALVVRRTRER